MPCLADLATDLQYICRSLMNCRRIWVVNEASHLVLSEEYLFLSANFVKVGVVDFGKTALTAYNSESFLEMSRNRII